jgi:CheY-like chemotaxis protein
VLIAEDNPDDRLLLQYAFRSSRLPNKYHIANNGAEAIAWLQLAEHGHNRLFPRPDLIVLDIQMPYKTGLEVLEWIRNEPSYRETPVVMMSGFGSPEIMEQALALGARSYLFKPGDYSELCDFIADFNMLESMHVS